MRGAGRRRLLLTKVGDRRLCPVSLPGNKWLEGLPELRGGWEGRKEGREEKEEERRREAKPARCAAGPVDYNWGREGAFASRWWAAGSGGEHEGGRMGASNGKQYGSEGEQREGGPWLGDSRSSGERGHPAVSPVACPSPPPAARVTIVRELLLLSCDREAL